MLGDLEEMKNGAIAHPKLQRGQKWSRRQIRQKMGKWEQIAELLFGSRLPSLSMGGLRDPKRLERANVWESGAGKAEDEEDDGVAADELADCDGECGLIPAVRRVW